MDVRHDGFKRRFEGNKMDHAYTAEEAIFYLKMHKYDLVCLDHDLAPEHYSDDTYVEDDSGYGVAKFISKMQEDDLPTQVLIHSWNPVGAERMKLQLHGLGIFVACKPF